MKRCDLHAHTASALFEVVFLWIWRRPTILFSQIVGCFRIDLLQVNALHIAENERKRNSKNAPNGFKLPSRLNLQCIEFFVADTFQ